MGLEWGGAWTGFIDKPHFQWTNGLTLAQLQKGDYPPDIKMKWENKNNEEKKNNFTQLNQKAELNQEGEDDLK
mgnify:CR=1 FL=1